MDQQRPSRVPVSRDRLPDARDGLTRLERIVLSVLRETQREFSERSVPSVTLYGRVLEQVDLDQETFQAILERLLGREAGRADEGTDEEPSG